MKVALIFAGTLVGVIAGFGGATWINEPEPVEVAAVDRVGDPIGSAGDIVAAVSSLDADSDIDPARSTCKMWSDVPRREVACSIAFDATANEPNRHVMIIASGGRVVQSSASKPQAAGEQRPPIRPILPPDDRHGDNEDDPAQQALRRHGP